MLTPIEQMAATKEAERLVSEIAVVDGDDLKWNRDGEFVTVPKDPSHPDNIAFRAAIDEKIKDLGLQTELDKARIHELQAEMREREEWLKLMEPRPVTKSDIDYAVKARTIICGKYPKIAQRLLKARMAVWTHETLKASLEPESMVPKLRSAGYIEEREDERLAFMPPYADRFHFFAQEMGYSLFEQLGEKTDSGFFTLGFATFLDVIDENLVVSIHEFYAERPRRFGCPSAILLRTYEDALPFGESGDVRSSTHGGLIIRYAMEAFMLSRYTHIEARRAPSIVDGARVSKGSSDIVTVVMRRPEKVEAQEARERREQADREGKKWILGYESHTEGHWRNQWYPSLGIHRRIFVEDFVRGSGKPKRPGETVVKVQRVGNS